jgi:phenylacetate-coenzyme A ligase PaaK-like adenylate-forming protein
MTQRDEVFVKYDKQKIWQKFCGFLDLSLEEFMGIQEDFLLEQLELVADTTIGKRIMNGKKPSTVEEFRRVCPLTKYNDYKDLLLAMKEDTVNDKAYMWVHTSGTTGEAKWIPYTERSWEKCVDYGIGSAILACASKRGDVNTSPRHRLLHNVAPRPYMAGYIIHSVSERTGWNMIPPAETFEQFTFQERVGEGFRIAMRTGLDAVQSLASVLIKIGEGFADRSNSRKRRVTHPGMLIRILKAVIRSKIEKRPMLPKDLWKLKGIMTMGTDTEIYKDKIKYYWGVTPAEFYGATEFGFVATQAWNKKSMTFVPDCCFLEFIPEEEWRKNKDDPSYTPKTVLFDQVEPGKIYELVGTSLHGMPILRYRVGDLIKIVSLRDEEADINLPQFMFQSRADDIIDIGNFFRLDERAFLIAIKNTNIKIEEWALRKEYVQDDPIIHIYMEVKSDHNASEIGEMIHQQLQVSYKDYKSMAEMLEINPIKITLLPVGTFMKYMEAKQAAGVDPGWLKPARINSSDNVINELLEISRQLG